MFRRTLQFLGCSMMMLMTIQIARAVEASGNATVTISPSAGAVSSVPPPPPVGVVQSNGTVRTTTGDAISTPILSTFRPLSSSGVTVGTAGNSAPAPATAPATTSPPPTAGTGGSGSGSQPAAGPRFASGGQSARSVLGSGAAVSVSGVPNQTFGISLPGKTEFITGGANIVIDSFLHDAGTTPTTGNDGNAVVNLGAQFGGGVNNNASTGTPPARNQATVGNSVGLPTANVNSGGASTDPAGSGARPLATLRPVVTASPFVNITISYN